MSLLMHPVVGNPVESVGFAVSLRPFLCSEDHDEIEIENDNENGICKSWVCDCAICARLLAGRIVSC